MRGTELTRHERRVARWQYAVGPIGLSDPAYDLLVRRLAIRSRAVWWVVPVAALALVPTAYLLFVDVNVSGSAWWRRRGLEVAALPLLLAVATTTLQELTYRWERRLAAGLSARVSRAASVGLATVLGPVRAACMAIAVVVDERLRSQDAFAAGSSLYTVFLALPVVAVFSESTPGWFFAAWFGGFFVLVGAQATAQARPPCKGAIRGPAWLRG